MDDVERMKLRMAQDPNSVTIGELMSLGGPNMQHLGGEMLLGMALGALLSRGREPIEIRALVDLLLDQFDDVSISTEADARAVSDRSFNMLAAARSTEPPREPH